MPTLNHLCGFEEGGYSDGPFGAGAHNYSDVGDATGLTWDTNIKRNGRYALKCTDGSGLYKSVTHAHNVGTIWFRFNSLTITTQVLFLTGVSAGFRVSTAGVLSASAGSTYTAGPTLATETWHHLSWYLNTSANPWVMKWTVNGNAQSDVSFAAAASTVTAVQLGMDATAGAGGAIWFDDWGLSVTGADYPIDPLAVEALYPTGDGTHVGQSTFRDESDIVSTGSSTYQKVATSGVSTFWYQNDVNASAYLEWTLPDTARTNPILGVSVTAAVRKSGVIGEGIGAVKLFADSAEGSVFAGDFPWGGEAWFGKTTLFLTTPASTAWTAARVNASTIRFGYSSDTVPQPYCEMVIMEVAFDDEPPEGEEDPPPDIDTGPGVWVDWGLDGFACGSLGSSDDTGSLARLVAEGAGGGGICDEITGDVMAIRWRRGSGPDHTGSSNPGEASIIVQNADHKYNPDNTASEFYGLLNPGAPVWIGVNTDGTFTAGGTVVGIFGGFLREIVPTPVDGAMPYAELICEDALGRYGRSSVSVAPSLSRSVQDFRNAILDDLGEDEDRRLLDVESQALFFSSVDHNPALTVLDELNRATATRHWVAPGDSFLEWFFYSTANRLWKVTDAADEHIDGEDIDAIAAYRVTEENIVNQQRVNVTPLSLSLATETVWTYGQTPFTVTSAESKIIWATFDDYVFNAAIQANVSSGGISTIITNFGTTAKLEINATTSPATIGSLVVTGQRLVRGDPEQVIAEDFASQSRYKVRAGSDISSDWAGQTGTAQGLADFLVWKYAQPLKRPDMTSTGKSAATLLTVLTRDLYDVITITVDRLDVVARRFEIVGLSGSYQAGGPWTVTYELQETRNQTALDYFEVDTDSVNGPALIAPF